MTVSKTQFTAGDLNVYSSPRDVSDVTRALRATGRRVMLVPTMGALHEGHLTLVRAAKRVQGAVVVVSIFVNPLQFGAGEDLHAYPRTLDEDLEVLRAEGVEIAFTPTAADMYPDGERTSVHPGPLGAELEGAARPTHFAGVLTVVLKLLQIVRPGSRVLRREGLPAAGADPADGRRPQRRHADRRGAHRAGSRRAGHVVAQSLPRRGANVSRRARCRRHCLRACTPHRAAPQRRWTPPAPCWTRCPRSTSTISRSRDPMLGPAPAEGIARMLIAARLGGTRLLDNIAIDIGATTGTDGHPRVGSDENHELPWRN